MVDSTLDSALQFNKGEKMARDMDPRSLRPGWRAEDGDARILIRKAAVLGAGVMGAQIAAHLANANVKPILFDLPAKEGKDKSAIANKANAGLAKMSPSPLSVASVAQQITPANYEEHLEWLRDCDLVIEAISERMD